MNTTPTPTNNNNLSETSILHYEFDEKLPIFGTITDSENIKFIWDEGNENAVTGFEITISESPDRKIEDAQEQVVPRLINILSSISGIALTHKPSKIKKIRNGQTFYVISKEVKMGWLNDIGINNIDIPKLSSLLYSSSKLTMQLAHAYNGRKALIVKDYPQAIREFYLIFEYAGLDEDKKYANLRHAVSHVVLSSKDAVDDLNINFGLPIQKDKELDLNDPAIKETLGRHASEFYRRVGLYLNGQLRSILAKT